MVTRMNDILNKYNIDLNSLNSGIPSEQKSKEFLDYIEQSFGFLSGEFTKIANSLVGIDIGKGNFKLKIQNFANKILLQFDTIFLLIQLNNKIDSDKSALDYQSIHIILRSIIEAILMFSYIYTSPKTEDEKYFRHLVWEFTDLQNIEKKKISHDDNSVAKAIELIINERYNNLYNEIQSNRYFINLSKRFKDKIIKYSQSRYDKNWSDIAVDFGLEKTRFDNVYSELCSYSHSGNNSIISNLIPFNLKVALLSHNLFYTLIIFSMFIIDYCYVTDKANEELSNNEKLIDRLRAIIYTAWYEKIIIKEVFLDNLKFSNKSSDGT